MQNYQAIVGQWIWLAVGRELAPIPDLEKPFDHPDDWCFAVVVALLSSHANIPSAVIPNLIEFKGEHTIRRVIAQTSQTTTTRLSDTPEDNPQHDRVVTAWLGSDIMVGAQVIDENKNRNTQFHHVTIHWRTPMGIVAWLKFVPTTRHIVAKAGPGPRLEITQPSLPNPNRGDDDPRTFAFHLGGFPELDTSAEANALVNGRWILPGITLSVVSNTIMKHNISTLQEDEEGLGARAIYAVKFTMEERTEWVAPWIYIQALS